MTMLRIALVLVFSELLFTWHSQAIAQQSTGDATASEVINHEKLAWETTKNKDKAGLERLLSEDYTEITDDGVFDKAGVLANMENITLTSYSLRDFKAKRIGPDTVLLIFQVTVTGKYKDHNFGAENNTTSLWMKRSGMWQNVCFQETPIPKQ